MTETILKGIITNGMLTMTGIETKRELEARARKLRRRGQERARSRARARTRPGLA